MWPCSSDACYLAIESFPLRDETYRGLFLPASAMHNEAGGAPSFR
jgi:hypothetical protein